MRRQRTTDIPAIAIAGKRTFGWWQPGAKEEGAEIEVAHAAIISRHGGPTRHLDHRFETSSQSNEPSRYLAAVEAKDEKGAQAGA
jgi:hypothetical protein